ILFVLEADICSYFDNIVRSQLIEMIEKRVNDGSVLRLMRKWINVGVIDDGRLLVTETGTGQGQVISPLLANTYLHYVLDEWFQDVVKPRLKGEAYETRYADDYPRAVPNFRLLLCTNMSLSMTPEVQWGCIHPPSSFTIDASLRVDMKRSASSGIPQSASRGARFSGLPDSLPLRPARLLASLGGSDPLTSAN